MRCLVSTFWPPASYPAAVYIIGGVATNLIINYEQILKGMSEEESKTSISIDYYLFIISIKKHKYQKSKLF